MMRRRDHKFWSMWGSQAWHGRTPREQGCWTADGGMPREGGGRMLTSAEWFGGTFSGEMCGINWLEGNHDGGPFTTPTAPALLGFDPSILDFCRNCPECRESNYARDDELAGTCHGANENVLRLGSRRLPWTMCVNLRWLTCASRGLLPGQGGPLIHFAVAPHDLEIAELHGDVQRQYVMTDVFYSEVCTLNELCTNGEELFGLKRGEIWRCNADQHAFDAFARLLQDMDG